MLTRPLSTISLWSSFEATIRTLIACIRLVQEPRILQQAKTTTKKQQKSQGHKTETKNNAEDLFPFSLLNTRKLGMGKKAGNILEGKL